jgi:hypothetical protein
MPPPLPAPEKCLIISSLELSIHNDGLVFPIHLLLNYELFYSHHAFVSAASYNSLPLRDEVRKLWKRYEISLIK